MEWVSVDDRLPDDGDLVLVCLAEYGEIYVAAYYGELWWSPQLGGDEMTEVTHWMPIPEPPEAQE